MKKRWSISNPEFYSDGINAKLRVSPWEGHRVFAYDLVKFLEPNLIVELGTHYGCSFFSFCQVVKDFKLNTKIIAIDTWQGDIQAGFYGDEVFGTINKTIDVYFKDLDIDLKRKIFDEALEEIEDESIDILHIDGLHTYNAVAHDYYTWLRKLKKNGIILFHDIASYLGYGSNKFWQEIKEKYKYPFLEFSHSWGLGVLFPKGDKIYKSLKEENIEDKVKFYQYKALYELEAIKNEDLTKMIEERDKAIKSNEVLIGEKDIVIKNVEEMIAERDIELNRFKSKKIIINFK